MLRKSILMKLVALILVFANLTPATAFAAEVPSVDPCNDSLLSEFDAYLTAPGQGKVRIHFYAYALQVLDEIGCTYVEVFESTDRVNDIRRGSFRCEDCSHMLLTNTFLVDDYLTYQGVIAKFYRCKVTIVGRKNGQESSYTIMTSYIFAQG